MSGFVQLTEYGNRRVSDTSNVPAIVASHGTQGRFAWDEYFSGKLRNSHTRNAYLRAVHQFLDWVANECVELQQVTPGMIGRYFDQHTGSPPTKKQHMSAIRGLFNVLVLRHVIVLNPALSVKTERFSAVEGKTPEISTEQARLLVSSIELYNPVAYRDRAIIAMLIYTAARVGAIAGLRRGDIIDEGTQFSIRFREKGGKHRSIPIRHDLEQYLQEYQAIGMPFGASNSNALFLTAKGRTGELTERAMSAVDISRMVKRRLRVTGLPTIISPHSFRSCTATDLLLQGVPLEDVQYLLGHSDSRVTRLYDRRQRRVTRNIVERISV